MIREEMIAKLVEGVDDWDMDTLIECMKDSRRSFLSNLNDTELQEEYNLNFD